MVYIVASPSGHLVREVPYGPIGYTGEIVFQGTDLSKAMRVGKDYGYPVYTYNEEYNRLEEVNISKMRYI